MVEKCSWTPVSYDRIDIEKATSARRALWRNLQYRKWQWIWAWIYGRAPHRETLGIVFAPPVLPPGVNSRQEYWKEDPEPWVLVYSASLCVRQMNEQGGKFYPRTPCFVYGSVGIMYVEYSNSINKLNKTGVQIILWHTFIGSILRYPVKWYRRSWWAES